MLIGLVMHAAMAQVERIERPATDPSAQHVVVVACPLQPWNADAALRKHPGRVTVVQIDRPVASREQVVDALTHLDVTDATVVAVGTGAALALQAGWQPKDWLLVAPVTHSIPMQGTRSALSGTTDDDRLDDQHLIAGTVNPDWAHTTTTLGLDRILLGEHTVDLPSANATVLLSAGDELSTVEALVPVAHQAGLTIERVGTGGWIGRDLSHGELIGTPPGWRATRRALRRLWRSP